MSNDIWKKEYDRLLQEGRQNNEVIEADDLSGNRENPRFGLSNAHVWIRVPTRFDLIEVSITGISFFSNMAFGVDELVMLTLDKAFVIEAQVKECVLVESNSDMLEVRYRIGCLFTDSSHGMQLLVMLKEMSREGKVEPMK